LPHDVPFQHQGPAPPPPRHPQKRLTGSSQLTPLCPFLHIKTHPLYSSPKTTYLDDRSASRLSFLFFLRPSFFLCQAVLFDALHFAGLRLLDQHHQCISDFLLGQAPPLCPQGLSVPPLLAFSKLNASFLSSWTSSPLTVIAIDFIRSIFFLPILFSDSGLPKASSFLHPRRKVSSGALFFCSCLVVQSFLLDESPATHRASLVDPSQP